MRLRRLLQRKSHIKTELCVRLSALRLFHVAHVVENMRSALSFQLARMLSMQRQRIKYLLLWAGVVVRNSKIKLSRRHLADYEKKITPKSVPHVQNDYFTSFNQSNR